MVYYVESCFTRSLKSYAKVGRFLDGIYLKMPLFGNMHRERVVNATRFVDRNDPQPVSEFGHLGRWLENEFRIRAMEREL